MRCPPDRAVVSARVPSPCCARRSRACGSRPPRRPWTRRRDARPRRGREHDIHAGARTRSAQSTSSTYANRSSSSSPTVSIASREIAISARPHVRSGTRGCSGAVRAPISARAAGVAEAARSLAVRRTRSSGTVGEVDLAGEDSRARCSRGDRCESLDHVCGDRSVVIHEHEPLVRRARARTSRPRLLPPA